MDTYYYWTKSLFPCTIVKWLNKILNKKYNWKGTLIYKRHLNISKIIVRKLLSYKNFVSDTGRVFEIVLKVYKWLAQEF